MSDENKCCQGANCYVYRGLLVKMLQGNANGGALYFTADQ